MKKQFIIGLVLLFASCTQQKVDLEEEKEKIVQCWIDWPKKSIDGAPEFYFAEDAILMGQKLPSIKGKKELAKFYAAMPKIPGMVVKWNERPNIIRFSNSGDMAYSIDTLRFSVPDSSGKLQTEISHGVHVWNKDSDGNWRVVLSSMYPAPN